MPEKKINETWVKLYRKSLQSSVWHNATIWMVWSWCLMKANYETTRFPFNGKDIEIKKGQFITGIDKALKEVPTSRQSYRTAITYLKSTGRITVKSTNKFSIYTIVNWEKYQSDKEKLTGKLTNEQQATNMPLTTYKNIKNDKNNKEISEFSFKSYKRPTYNGMQMRKKGDKWFCIPKDGGEWLIFAGKKKDIKWE